MQLQDFKLERFFAKYEFNSRYLLCSSDVEAVTVGELLRYASAPVDALIELKLGYVESQGSHALREAIARATGPNITTEQVLVFAGGQDAILCALAALVQPGDDVVAVLPTYQSLEEVPRALGGRVRPVWLRASRAFAFDVDEILAAVTPRTKVVTLVSPHNPTGVVLGSDELTRLCTTLEQRGVTLLCDEIYRELMPMASPAAATLSVKALSVGGLAKAYGLAGLRIGWVVTQDTALLARMAAIKDYTSICHAAPSQHLAVLAMTRARGALLQRAQKLIAANVARMQTFCAMHPELRWYPSMSTISVVQLDNGETTATFCDRIVQKSGVLLMPGELFDLPGFFRVGLGRADGEASLAALTAALR